MSQAIPAHQIPAYLKKEHTEKEIANLLENENSVKLLKYCVDIARGNLTPKEDEALRKNAHIIYGRINVEDRTRYELDTTLSKLLAIQVARLSSQAMAADSDSHNVSSQSSGALFSQPLASSQPISSSSMVSCGPPVPHTPAASVNLMPNSGSSETLAVDQQKSKQEREESSRMGMLWDCIETKPNPAGGKGKMLTFKLRQFPPGFMGADQRSEIIHTIFPADEPEYFSDAAEILGISVYSNWRDKFNFLHRLGYDVRDPNIIVLPDLEALKSNWSQLQEEHRRKQLPPLPDLIILSSEGIASDREFVEAYLIHGVLLSDGQEFVHDHFFHLIPLLLGMRKPGWEQQRELAVKFVQTAKEKVIQVQTQLKQGTLNVSKDKINLRIQQLDTVLGMFTDILSARELPLTDLVDQEAFRDIGRFFETSLIGRMNSGQEWRDFWTRRGYPYLYKEEITEITNLLKTPMAAI